MIKCLQCIVLISSILSVSLFGDRNIGLTKEIDNMRESIICSVDSSFGKTEENEEAAEGQITLGYTDGFWVEEDETVYLLATYGCEALEYKRGEIRRIPLLESILPADIVSYNNKLYIFDDLLSEVQCYTMQGELVFRIAVELKEDYVKHLVVTTQGVAVRTYGGQELLVEEETGDLTVQSYEAVAAPKLDGYDFAEYLATDEDGNIYAVYTKLVNKCSIISGELTLQVHSAEGNYIGQYILPVKEYVYLPGTYVQILENGNIYLMIPTEETVEVRKIALRDEMESGLASITETVKRRESDYIGNTSYRKKVGTACTEVVAFSREEVRERAVAMAEYTWTLKKTHTLISKSEKGVVLPREIEAIKKKNEDVSSWKVKMTGIPYCWGGFYALDVGFGGKTFQSVIDKKYVAGNINPVGYYKYMTAGLDCSGFVSAALGFTKKQGTSGLNDIGSKVNSVKKLQQMDMFVYPGEHVIFFCEWLDDTAVLVAEVAVREGKASVHPKSLNELVVNSKYQMRSPW